MQGVPSGFFFHVGKHHHHRKLAECGQRDREAAQRERRRCRDPDIHVRDQLSLRCNDQQGNRKDRNPRRPDLTGGRCRKNDRCVAACPRLFHNQSAGRPRTRAGKGKRDAAEISRESNRCASGRRKNRGVFRYRIRMTGKHERKKMTREEKIEEIRQLARKNFSLGYNCARDRKATLSLSIRVFRR